MNLGDSLDVDNLVAIAAGIAGEILTCQCADSQGYLRGGLDLTTQLGSGLGQMDHQGRPLVPEAAHAQFAAAVGGEVIEGAGSRQQASADSERRTLTHSRQQASAGGGGAVGTVRVGPGRVERVLPGLPHNYIHSDKGGAGVGGGGADFERGA